MGAWAWQGWANNAIKLLTFLVDVPYRIWFYGLSDETEGLVMTFTYEVITAWGALAHSGMVTAKNERGARIAIGKRHFIHREIVIIKRA